MTRFPEYISARLPVPLSLTYALLRRFHAAAAVTMVSTRSLIEELGNRGFAHLGMWTRGVDTDLFSPERAATIDLPRPIFVSVGRLAVEKNLAAFLALDLPGSKVVIGEGPQAGELQRRFPNAHFLGLLEGETLAAHLAAADVFVFPSRTDTFDEDLKSASVKALAISRAACRSFALTQSWERSALQFISHCRPCPRLQTAWTRHPRQHAFCNPYSASGMRQETDV
jgi:glycosyltransferase involved in cell wall biosynthesis